MDQDELLTAFSEESAEILEQCEIVFLSLEKEPHQPELINSAFRYIHTIKGSSGYFELENIESLTHHMEEILSLARSQKLDITPELIDLQLQGIDQLKSLIADLPYSKSMNVTALSEKIASLKHGTPISNTTNTPSHEVTAQGDAQHQDTSVTSRKKDTDQRAETSQHNDNTLEKHPFTALPTLDEGDLFWVQTPTTEDIDLVCERLEQFGNIEDLNDGGELAHFLVSTTSPQTELEQLNLGSSKIVKLSDQPDAKESSALAQEQLESPPQRETLEQAPHPTQPNKLEEPEIQKQEQAKPKVEQQEQRWKETVQKETMPEGASQKPSAPSAKTEERPTAEIKRRHQKLKTNEHSVRVPFNLLSQLIDLSGELILSRNQFISKLDGDLLDNFKAMSQQISDLQDGLMKTRMQPLSTITTPFPRIIRDLSRKLKKEVKLEMEGENIELDKTVLEALGGPFTHILRNSMDHGIEIPEERKRLGKTRHGTIRISASHRGSNVLIVIKDDGKGIDHKHIRQSALSKGLITPEEEKALSQREAVELIWQPGFSSSETVSNVSGRGVGMDVVRSEILAMGGFAELESVAGLGTKLSITLPLSTAIIHSLLVSLEGERYAIPRGAIIEVLSIKSDNELLEKVNDVEMIRYRNMLFPLVHMADVLGLKKTFSDDNTLKEDRRSNIAERRRTPEEEADLETTPKTRTQDRRGKSTYTILMIKNNRNTFGLIVDDIGSQEETVVKPINAVIRDRYQHFMGTTILSNGKVCFIIDPVGFCEKAGLVFDVDAPNLLNNTASKKSQEEAERHLMFTCATGEHCGLITGLIDFTHVTTKDQLMSMNGRYFVRIHERDYQLIDLSEYTELQSIDIDSLDDIFLIIPKHIKSNLAFLASSIRGIEDIPTNLPYVVENKAGTLGTVIWNEELTTLIDLFNLESLITGKKEPTLRLDRRVLLLEDTPMFQKIVKDHLENMGFHVSLAGDGLEGLAHLQKQTFDVIVSDIEMPNMNGYEFCATVREDPQWEHLPIIAMTSLKSDEAKTRASAVGFTEYLVKINRNDFTKTLQRVLGDQNIG